MFYRIKSRERFCIMLWRFYAMAFVESQRNFFHLGLEIKKKNYKMQRTSRLAFFESNEKSTFKSNLRCGPLLLSSSSHTPITLSSSLNFSPLKAAVSSVPSSLVGDESPAVARVKKECTLRSATRERRTARICDRLYCVGTRSPS